MTDFSEIPNEMKRARRWLLWKLSPTDNKKIPFYVTGKERGKGGQLDSDNDLLQLATFDEAMTAFNAGKYSGIGFALGKDETGNFWQGIDLDKVNENNLQHLSSILPGYVESSPSGKGVHAIGYGAGFETLGSNGTGTEAYSSKRYFTVTGLKVRGDICDIYSFVQTQLEPIHNAKHNSLLVEHVDSHDSQDSQDLQIHKQGRGVKEEKGNRNLTIIPLSELPERCKPHEVGTRNIVIFHLARHLKSLYPTANVNEFRLYIKEWVAEYESNIGTKDFAETWADFRNAWKSIKILEGESQINKIVSDIDSDTVAPPEYYEKGYEGSGWACLQLCYGLSRISESGNFFLSGRKIKELLNIPQRTAANMLKMMVDDEILTVIEKGDRHKAHTYQYIGMHLNNEQ